MDNYQKNQVYQKKQPQEMFYEKCVLENSAKSTGKTAVSEPLFQ